MKKAIVILIVLAMIPGSIFAQGFYLRAGGGYGLPIATSSLGENFIRTVVNSNTSQTDNSSLESVTGSYGAGSSFNFALGYKINENFILELNSQYLVSNKYETVNNYSYTDVGYTYVDNYSALSSARGFFINPSLVFSAGFGKGAPYGRFGLLVGSPKITGSDSYYYDGDGIDSGSSKWEFTKGMALGFQGAVGMNWELTDKLDIFTELNYISMTYYPGEYNLVEKTNNGQDVLDTYIMSYRRTIYKKKYDPSSENLDYNKPSVALREGNPFSSISVQVGIRFSFWQISD